MKTVVIANMEAGRYEMPVDEYNMYWDYYINLGDDEIVDPSDLYEGEFNQEIHDRFWDAVDHGMERLRSEQED